MAKSKKNNIMQTATYLFSQFGFHSVGIDLITKESDIARMTFYRNFKGKEDLVKKILEKRSDDIMLEISTLAEKHQEPMLKIKEIFEWYKAWFSTPQFKGCIFERAIADYGDNKEITNTAVSHKKRLQHLIFSFFNEDYSDCDSKELSEKLSIIIDGSVSEAHAFNNPESADKAWSIAEIILLSYKNKQDDSFA